MRAKVIKISVMSTLVPEKFSVIFLKNHLAIPDNFLNFAGNGF